MYLKQESDSVKRMSLGWVVSVVSVGQWDGDPAAAWPNMATNFRKEGWSNTNNSFMLFG